jgi:nicotinamide mononucleotide transporter
MRVSRIEIVAFLLGLANVTLVVRRSVWNYPFGLAMVALYARIFFDQKLYSDALLQLFFFVVQIYGWWHWMRARADAGEVRVELLSTSQRLWWLIGCAVASAVWGELMHRYTDAAYPWWDGTIAMLSVAAQILMSRRYLENWVLWIAVDVLAIGLFPLKGLGLATVLYAIFLALSVWGLIQWQRVRSRAGLA